MPRLNATGVHFIKLGRSGQWEAEAIHDGVLRFGYHDLPHFLCLAGDWEHCREIMLELRGGNERVATSDINQVRLFYEAPESAIFVTFHGGRLWWCRPRGIPEQLPDMSKRRATVAGWSSTSEGGAPLTADRLSGRLLAVQGFRGTICAIEAEDYLLRKLGDEPLPEVAAALAAEDAMLAAIRSLLNLLTWKDFELLVDLVFSASGWKRVGQTGATQRTVDLELVLPSTRERAFVQVKSRATPAELQDYAERMQEMEGVSRMFFVWHTGDPGSVVEPGRVTLIGPDELAGMVLDAGLGRWLRMKVG